MLPLVAAATQWLPEQRKIFPAGTNTQSTLGSQGNQKTNVASKSNALRNIQQVLRRVPWRLGSLVGVAFWFFHHRQSKQDSTEKADQAISDRDKKQDPTKQKITFSGDQKKNIRGTPTTRTSDTSSMGSPQKASERVALDTNVATGQEGRFQVYQWQYKALLGADPLCTFLLYERSSHSQ